MEISLQMIAMNLGTRSDDIGPWLLDMKIMKTVIVNQQFVYLGMGQDSLHNAFCVESLLD